MANHVSAEKRNRQRITRSKRNRTVKSAVRTELKKARAAIQATGQPGAPDTVKNAVSALDRAASKGIVHPKAASRSKARLARALYKASQQAGGASS